MDAGQLMQNAQQQLNKEIRVGSSHHADKRSLKENPFG